MSCPLKEKTDNYNYKNTSRKKSCPLQKKTDKYKYKNTSPANTLLTTDSKSNKSNICRYKTYDVFYDEYIFFISALNYKKVDYQITTVDKEKNIACSYQISGKYDFIVKSFYPQNVSPIFSHPKIIKDIQICKVIDRYAPQDSHLVRMFNITDFYNIDVKLSGFNLFADFVEIEAPSDGSLSDDLINALENLDNPENADHLQYVYVIYKLENIQTKKQTWLICLRYKCHDYCKRHFLQEGLDRFVDNIEHIKTTYISNNSSIRINNIRGIFEKMHYENVLGRVLCTRNIRDLMHKIYKNLTSQDDNKYLQELRKNKDFYNNLLNKVRDYQFYISYKQSDSQSPDNSYQIRHVLHKWFKDNKFKKVSVDSEVLDPSQELEDYMQALGTSDLVVICLSEEYFRSINCMYELSLVIKNSKPNGLGKKAIFVSKRFLLDQNLDKIKSFWLEYTPSTENKYEKKRISVIKQKINELDNISDRLHVILQDKDKEELHYEKAIEAILSNIVEKILNEELEKTSTRN